MRIKDADDKPTDTTRAEQVEADGGEIPQPEVTAAYLQTYLQDMGVYGYGAMGPIPLSAQEITAWSQGSGIALLPWEFAALRRASAAWVGEYHAANEQPPYGDPDLLADPEVIEAKLERMFERLARPLVSRK